MNQSDLDKKHEEESSQLVPFLTWGWQFALTLGFLAWGGHWLDQKLETKFLFVLVGIFMGLFGGFYNLYKKISQIPKKRSK